MSRKCKSWLLAIASTLPVLGMGASAFGGGAPLEDIGFTPATPLPDPDLVVVRELFYGAEGVDLTAYGIGGGPVDYVQSIYFRFFVDNDVPTVDAFAGRVIFPQGVEILGIVTDEADLGGSTDDGVATETDLLFGIATDPNDYSENARGFECCGGVGSSEFVCITSPNTFAYGLNVTNGVDDFRVIIDYGDGVAGGLSFDIQSFLVGSIGGSEPSSGIRIGDDANPVILGSGDFGEVGSVLDIPLTATEAPGTGTFLTFNPVSSVYLLRNTTGPTFVDAYNVNLDLPAPDFVPIPENVDNPVGITDGPDGLLYALGQSNGFATIDVVAQTEDAILFTDQAGTNRDITGLPGSPDLFLLRDTSGDSFIDRFSLTMFDVVESFVLPAVTDPQGVTDGPDGLLYAVGSGGMLATLNPSTGDTASVDLGIPSGTYVDITSREGVDKLYLARDGASGSHVDVYDISDESMEFDFLTTDFIDSPIAITDGPKDQIHLIGAGRFMTIGADDGAVFSQNDCLGFTGSYVSITNLSQETTAAPDRRPEARSLLHWAQPNPTRRASTIRFALQGESGVRVALYDVRGELVRTLWEARAGAGLHTVPWDGFGAGGRRLPTGVYFYVIEAGEARASGRINLLR